MEHEVIFTKKFFSKNGTDVLNLYLVESEDHSEKQHLMLLRLWVGRGRFSKFKA